MPQRSLYLMPPVILASWGGAFLYLAMSGKLRVLLNPLFWPLEIVCGVVLVALAIAYFFLFRPVVREAASVRFPVGQAGVLFVPLLVAAVLAPPSFSAAALEARAGLSGGKILAQSGSGSTTGDTVELVDLAAAAYYPENIPKVTGKKVKYLGQFLPGSKPGEFRFCRVLMSCCAADATPIYLHIVGSAPGKISALDWMNVEGQTFFRQDDGEWSPCVRLTSVTPAQAPPDPYLYAMRMKTK
jgi:uncharacterized repeat protein (TIGR03943 family)